jgi:cyclic pyranopterin phosphate synthase
VVPLCHPQVLTRLMVEFEIDAAANSVHCRTQLETVSKTGGMEALNAVRVGLLTTYAICKAIDRAMVMADVRVLEKQGGKSGEWKVEV